MASPYAAVTPGSSGNAMLDEWLQKVKGVNMGDLGSGTGAQNYGTAAVDHLLEKSDASKYLNPYYIAAMKNRAQDYEGAYALTQAMGGSEGGGVRQPESGGDMSLGQFLQDRILRSNGDANTLTRGGIGAGYQNGRNYLADAVKIIQAGQAGQGYTNAMGNALSADQTKRTMENLTRSTNGGQSAIQKVLQSQYGRRGDYGTFGDANLDRIQQFFNSQAIGGGAGQADLGQYITGLVSLARSLGLSV